MNLTSLYHRATRSQSSTPQKAAFVENVPRVKHIREDDESQKPNLKKLFPSLEEEASSENVEPTVYADERPLVDELV